MVLVVVLVLVLVLPRPPRLTLRLRPMLLFIRVCNPDTVGTPVGFALAIAIYSLAVERLKRRIFDMMGCRVNNPRHQYLNAAVLYSLGVAVRPCRRRQLAQQLYFFTFPLAELHESLVGETELLRFRRANRVGPLELFALNSAHTHTVRIQQ